MYQNIEQIKVDFPNLVPDDNHDVEGQIAKNSHRVTFLARLDGKRIVFRFYPAITPQSKIWFENESRILIRLQKKIPGFEPKVIFSDAKKMVLIESYLEGDQSGDLFSFSEDFITKVSPKEVIDFLSQVKEVVPGLLELPVSSDETYKKELKSFLEILPEFNDVIMDMIEYYNLVIRSSIINQESYTHGDLNAGNIIYNDEGLVGLIDWESARPDNYWKDFAYILSRAYDYHDWVEDYFKKLELKDDTRKTFEFFQKFSLMTDLLYLKKILASRNYEFYRSKTLTQSEVERLI